MKYLPLLLAFSAPVVLSGCVISVDGNDRNHASEWEEREQNNRKHISNLQQGAAFEAIARKMGVADFSEMHQKDDGVYRVLYYRTQRTMDDGVTTKDECTPLVFKNGALVGWGDSAYSDL